MRAATLRNGMKTRRPNSNLLMTAFPCKDEYPAPRTDEPARAFPLPEHKP
jgi:hypothetical protein